MPFVVSRRSFLLTSGALAVAACSSGSKSKATPPTTVRPKWNLVGLFAADALAAGTKARLPFSIADADGGIPSTPPVTSLTVDVIDAAGKTVSSGVAVAAHSEGLPRAYFPVELNAATAGIYTVRSNIEGTTVEQAVQIGDGGTIPRPGQPMIPFDTPTTADPRGVDLLCTRKPACPLHDVTLTQALAEQRPVAFLISTPLYCQVGICGPVLDLLVAAQAEHPQVRFLHSEVYPSEAAAQPGKEQTVPVVAAYGLTFEPVLFLATPDGKVQRRLDTIFDASELRSALTALVR
ncbi:MAG: hypothetical protein ABIV94_07970 [Acidimicrobiales bacterium]